MKKFLSTGLSCLLVFCSASLAVSAEDGEKIYTDPKNAGPDYAVQGEYQTSGGEFGAQVVALGGGKFSITGYPGGLPGAGWSRGTKRYPGKGETKDGVTTFQGDDGGWSSEVKDGVMTVFNSDGNEIGEQKKLVRKSPTLGAKPPEEAIVLFDGKSADNFDNGKIVQEMLLLADCSSKQKFGDHRFHLEFRTPFKPTARGQARGNSGVYLQSRYELQVLDSFGLEGENNECGGIYSINKPKVNMCLPPLTWQTYDIDFTAALYDASGKKVKNARATIKHNGVVIHDNLELTHGTPGRHPEGPGDDAIYLQGHGNPVVYRNIWVVKK